MKTTLALFLSFILFGAYSQSTKQMDTLYSTLTVVQADSLITANTGNPDFFIIDVRTPADFSVSHLANAINIDFWGPNFNSIIQALDHSKKYLLYCASGSRSTQTFILMQSLHFLEVYNMQGGINAWIAAGYPVETATGIETADLSKVNPIAYPNPVSGSFNVSISPMHSGNLSLIDIAGNVVFSKTSATGVQFIDMTGNHSGIYFLRFDSGSRLYAAKVILK